MTTQSPSMASQATAELPKLPESRYIEGNAGRGIVRWGLGYTANQMQAYGLACYEAGRASRAQSEPEGWRAALQFYAEKSHFTISEESAWDTVSGEPANFWCDEEGTATVEDGTVAAMALAGTPLKDEDDSAGGVEIHCPKCNAPYRIDVATWPATPGETK